MARRIPAFLASSLRRNAARLQAIPPHTPVKARAVASALTLARRLSRQL